MNWMHSITPGYPILMKNSPIWRAFSKSERLAIAVLLHHSKKTKLAYNVSVELYRMEQLGVDIEASSPETLPLQKRARVLQQIWRAAYTIGRWTLQRAQTLKWWNLTIQEASVHLSNSVEDYEINEGVRYNDSLDSVLATFVERVIYR